MRYIVGFARFWYDFIVGDSAILAVGGIAVLAAGFGLSHAEYPTLAEFVLPGLVLGTLAVSLRFR
jgi:hypothetical protein